MKIELIKLTDIPVVLLPIINDSDKSERHLYLRDKIVKSIFIFGTQYRISAGGEYRYPFDTDLSLEVY